MSLKFKLRFILFAFILLPLSFLSAQSIRATLVLYDGTRFEGFGKIVRGNKILFRMDLEDKPDIWDRELVHRIEFDDIYQTIAYEYVQLGPFNKHELLRVIEPGFLTLYAHNETNWIPNFPPELSGGPPSTPISSTRFYLKRKNSDRLFEVVANQRRWKETLKLCFEGCSEVLEEINGENIGNLIIEDLVWNYNEFCADYSN